MIIMMQTTNYYDTFWCTTVSLICDLCYDSCHAHPFLRPSTVNGCALTHPYHEVGRGRNSAKIGSKKARIAAYIQTVLE